ncbi:MAG: DUF1800 family protein [Verrucomicrobiota bacterium]
MLPLSVLLSKARRIQLALLLGLTSSASAVDLNSDGLCDLWQQQYGAEALLPSDDTDGDGYLNSTESTAGTDPFNLEDHPGLALEFLDSDVFSLQLDFRTNPGRSYSLAHSSDLATFTPITPEFSHNGGIKSFTLVTDQTPSTTGAIFHEHWANITGTDLGALTDLPSFSASPDGVSTLSMLQIPRLAAGGYGARLRTLITPPQTGAYTFYISSGSTAQVFLSSGDSPSNISLICEVLPSQSGIASSVFDRHPNQSSSPIVLNEGQSYYLEIRYLAPDPYDHCQLAWDGDAFNGPTIIGQDALVPLDLTDNAIPPYAPHSNRNFYRLKITSYDQDGDGLFDWEEQLLATEQPTFFFDSETIGATNDFDAIQTLIQEGNSGVTTVSLAASDTTAFESNAPNVGPDDGEITITRTGALTAVTIQLCNVPLEKTGDTATICDGTCCILVGSAGDEKAEPSDYVIYDKDGNTISDFIDFAFGETTKVLRVVAVPDALYEYPETLNIAIAPSESGEYQISPTLNGASIQCFDAPDHPDNDVLLIGGFTKDGNAATDTNGTGYSALRVNGTRRQALITSTFSNLTSAQTNSHVHKAQAGPAPGAVVYPITETPGDAGSSPLHGPLSDYLWDLTQSSSKQMLIDSIFAQNGETPLYLNVHTSDNPGGEIWAFYEVFTGSTTPPGTPDPDINPGESGYESLTGNDLELEVRRFLNQATFGAIEEDVEALITIIENARISDPDYHRATAFEAWLDEQMDPLQTPQSYFLEYTLAQGYQMLKIHGYFDPVQNPTNSLASTPLIPDSWPSVDRSASNPEHWYLDGVYPINRTHMQQANTNGVRRPPSEDNRRHAFWQMMINSKDQLRHKTGYALQQIVVASDEPARIRTHIHGTSNYQDMLNHYAFSYYRDILGFVNWSPIMGYYLSSFKNQKGIDLDGDTIDDISPDENLARENMQLFSIGLFDLWEDGTIRLDSNGLPRNTYDNIDIQEFAKVLTGQSFSVDNDPDDSMGGVPYASIPRNNDFDANVLGNNGFHRNRFDYPMDMFGAFHDTSVKTFAGTTIDNTHLSPRQQGIADIEDAMDWLAGKPGDGLPDYDMVNSHGSVPAFICRRLIQRFTTSNPSREYLHRVASVFKNSEGDLGLTVKAILLDSEARQLNATDSFGLKKSPLEGIIQVLRNLGAHSLVPNEPTGGLPPYDTAPGDYSNPDLYLSSYGYPVAQLATQRLNSRFLFRNSSEIVDGRSLRMTPFRQSSVFNFYLPDFSPTGAISNAALVAPEMQLATEPGVTMNINYTFPLLTDEGIDAEPLARTAVGQLIAFNGDSTTVDHNNIRINAIALANELYPSTEPASANGFTSEFIANLSMVDALDRRLCDGIFAQRYPIDPSDDGANNEFRNPREVLVHTLSYGSDNMYDGNNDNSDRGDRLNDALFLILASPEFQIRK